MSNSEFKVNSMDMRYTQYYIYYYDICICVSDGDEVRELFVFIC